ncbi:MAG: hypothetical protein ACLQFT_03385 [Steroidobacteraceae bacterium]
MRGNPLVQPLRFWTGLPSVVNIAMRCIGALHRRTASAHCIEEDAVSLSISSAAFAHGGSIPKRYTCDGADVRRLLHGPDCHRTPRAWR